MNRCNDVVTLQISEPMVKSMFKLQKQKVYIKCNKPASFIVDDVLSESDGRSVEAALQSHHEHEVIAVASEVIHGRIRGVVNAEALLLVMVETLALLTAPKRLLYYVQSIHRLPRLVNQHIRHLHLIIR